ncbi:YhjD/YihY/BrkB family envelope integrity protein [Gryllotalpicola ginsengisoli]|uniref:YhjD/YihY/BrkB family envelope integrity protein n=1 Tax=Gryllotalpicola ginsengisoli TaxID=444608 RepID=UPI0003B40241|nr:YhjD/YihY/BrkB family envelope integrity protein [Gryllotalpicola ginsengisoli]
MARTPDEIRRDLERTRARLSQRVDELAHRVSPPRPDVKAHEAVDSVRERVSHAASVAKEKLGDAAGAVRGAVSRDHHDDEEDEDDDVDDADPHHYRKPQTPPQVRPRAWKYTLKRTLREFSRHQATDIAATLTYYGVLSIFPAMLAVFSLLGVIGQGPSTAKTVLDIIGGFAPSKTTSLIRDPIMQFATAKGAGIGVIVGIVMAAWTASGYVGAFSRAINRIYGVGEGRPVWKLRPIQLAITLIIIVLVALMALLLVVSGPVTDAIGQFLHVGGTVTTVWEIGKWPVLAAAVIVVIALLYWGTPNAKQPKFRWISLGSLTAMVLLAIATLGFGFYVANLSNYNKSYGSLAGVIIFLVWLWIVNLVLLLGAEFDAELERGRELQAGMPAEREIQLPPRDERQLDKQNAKDEKLYEQAADLRRDHARDE